MPADYLAHDLDSIPGARRAVWSRANLSEVLPELPSPASWAALERMLNEGTRRYYGRLLPPDEKFGPPFAMLAGRPYWNLTLFSWLGGFVRMSPATLMRDVGQTPNVSADDDRPIRHSLREYAIAAPQFVRLGFSRVFLPLLLRLHFRRLRRLRQRFDASNIDGLTNVELWRHIETLNRLGPLFIARTQAIVGVLSFEVLRPLERLCGRFGFPTTRLLDSYLAVGPRSVSGQQAFDLLHLGEVARKDEDVRAFFSSRSEPFEDFRSRLRGSEFLAEFDRYLADYGHRAPFESDPSIPRYREDPTAILRTVGNYATTQEFSAPVPDDESRELNAEQTWREFSLSVPTWQKPFVLPIVHLISRKAKKAYALRELNRSEIVRVGEYLRKFVLALGSRFVAKGWIEASSDVFFLQPNELASVVAGDTAGSELSERVRQRRLDQQELATIEAPATVDGRKESHPESSSADVTRASELHGLCISTGLVEGEVVIVRGPTEFERMRPAAILVARATDPAWTPLFVQASGVIVEVGGQISHAAIVARELGLPALANVHGATSLLRDGDVVRLDATNGSARVLGRTKEDHAD